MYISLLTSLSLFLIQPLLKVNSLWKKKFPWKSKRSNFIQWTLDLNGKFSLRGGHNSLILRTTVHRLLPLSGLKLNCRFINSIFKYHQCSNSFTVTILQPQVIISTIVQYLDLCNIWICAKVMDQQIDFYITWLCLWVLTKNDHLKRSGLSHTVISVDQIFI